jgi:hypothetical protein
MSGETFAGILAVAALTSAAAHLVAWAAATAVKRAIGAEERQ